MMRISPYTIVTVALSRFAGSSPLTAATARSVTSITRCADIGAALGLVPALTLPSQIAKDPAATGSTAAYKSRSLTPTWVVSFIAIVAALVLLHTPCALAVTPLTDRNIRRAATAWIDKPTEATAKEVEDRGRWGRHDATLAMDPEETTYPIKNQRTKPWPVG
jgi:hypothetical protein